MTAFGQKQPIWDYEHIFQFIAGPQKYIDGTKMTFIGMKDRQDRINIIAYLHTLGSSLPIPAPNPAAAAPAKPGAAPAGGASNTAPGPAPAAGASNSAAEPAPAAKGK
jgi:cytochrome c